MEPYEVVGIAQLLTGWIGIVIGVRKLIVIDDQPTTGLTLGIGPSVRVRRWCVFLWNKCIDGLLYRVGTAEGPDPSLFG